MMRPVALLVVLAACAGDARHAPDVEVPTVRIGVSGDAWSLSRIREAASETTLRVHEPYENREITFRGVPAVAFLDRALGPSWRAAGDVELECADGYRAILPSSRFLEHRALLAYARTDQPAFRLAKTVGNEVQQTELAPLYLVWSNLDDEVVRSEGDWGWPYQVTAIRVAAADVRFSTIAPPAGAPEAAARGFSAFRRWCASCHSIDGVGGEVGPELNRPVSVTTYMAPGWLRRWIDDPQAIRQKTKMPGLPREGVPDRERTLDDLVSYFESIAPPAPTVAAPAATTGEPPEPPTPPVVP